MATKTFDAVEMMHRGAAEVRRLTEGLSLDEEAAFWAARTRDLEALQARLRDQKTARDRRG